MIINLNMNSTSRSIGVGSPSLSKSSNDINKSPVVLHSALSATCPLFLFFLLINLKRKTAIKLCSSVVNDMPTIFLVDAHAQTHTILYFMHIILQSPPAYSKS